MCVSHTAESWYVLNKQQANHNKQLTSANTECFGSITLCVFQVGSYFFDERINSGKREWIVLFQELYETTWNQLSFSMRVRKDSVC